MCRKLMTIILCVICLVWLVRCNFFREVSPQEELIRKAVAAIKINDWEAYAKLTITSADFIMKASKISPFKAKQSYAGSVLKPEAQAKLQAQFRKAVRGGPGICNFKQGEFHTITGPVSRGNFPLPDGGYVPFTAYQVTLKIKGQVHEDASLDPTFIIVQWGSQYRIFDLLFKQPEPEY
ncbi:hypothetical protein ACFL27_00800 [candidate division CSSED10-310 bacterium]|uniref:DUF4019 domain-containing protein n=1 Tax=candidate division CSSED10-310 bacterium TaxID=2855610 RepID=A0ABV6YR83_UNCC1